ncbi:IclR family transcriptional regulator [Amycolatopsis acididurans]|uniref:IclR family transcriptional regulator n=1 Tax=Amycolatopsis acididurans TaxID=2724524 RepID=UPI0028B1CEB6|nr:IclR family transcriptional regulator [Amycolatopsis acididurans]
MTSVDHALQLAVILQVEGPLRVSEAAARLGVARSTAHRLLSMLVFRDFAVQDANRCYAAGPVLSLAARSHSRISSLRLVAMPFLDALAARLDESANLMVLFGDHMRFIGTVEGKRVLRVGSREGSVMPAHLVSGGKAILAELPAGELEALYAPEAWAGREQERPSLDTLRDQLHGIPAAGVALNVEGTEAGVTAVGRVVRTNDDGLRAAVSVSMPSTRFTTEGLGSIVRALTVATAGIEREFARKVTTGEN